MTKQIDLNKYTDFVEGVTSQASNDLTTFHTRLDALDANFNYENDEHGPDINVPLLITSAMGMCGEAGEFSELVKKAVFHNKEFTKASLEHASKELGDVIWYWANACRSLGLDPNKVIADNVDKLSSRYPGGVFDPFYSENRKEGDV